MKIIIITMYITYSSIDVHNGLENTWLHHRCIETRCVELNLELLANSSEKYIL